MPTIQQLVRKGRHSKIKVSKSIALNSCPQKGEYASGSTLLHQKT